MVLKRLGTLFSSFLIRSISMQVQKTVQNTMIHTAVAGLLALGMVAISSTANAADDGKEKCFGVAKAGQNDCASGVHSCAGQSKVDMDKAEWKYVAAGTCKTLKGLTADEAKKLKM